MTSVRPSATNTPSPAQEEEQEKRAKQREAFMKFVSPRLIASSIRKQMGEDVFWYRLDDDPKYDKDKNASTASLSGDLRLHKVLEPGFYEIRYGKTPASAKAKMLKRKWSGADPNSPDESAWSVTASAKTEDSFKFRVDGNGITPVQYADPVTEKELHKDLWREVYRGYAAGMGENRLVIDFPNAESSVGLIELQAIQNMLDVAKEMTEQEGIPIAIRLGPKARARLDLALNSRKQKEIEWATRLREMEKESQEALRKNTALHEALEKATAEDIKSQSNISKDALSNAHKNLSTALQTDDPDKIKTALDEAAAATGKAEKAIKRIEDKFKNSPPSTDAEKKDYKDLIENIHTPLKDVNKLMRHPALESASDEVIKNKSKNVQSDAQKVSKLAEGVKKQVIESISDVKIRSPILTQALKAGTTNLQFSFDPNNETLEGAKDKLEDLHGRIDENAEGIKSALDTVKKEVAGLQRDGGDGQQLLENYQKEIDRKS